MYVLFNKSRKKFPTFPSITRSLQTICCTLQSVDMVVRDHLGRDFPGIIPYSVNNFSNNLVSIQYRYTSLDWGLTWIFGKSWTRKSYKIMCCKKQLVQENSTLILLFSSILMAIYFQQLIWSLKNTSRLEFRLKYTQNFIQNLGFENFFSRISSFSENYALEHKFVSNIRHFEILRTTTPKNKVFLSSF